MKGNLLEIKNLSLHFEVFGGSLKVLDGVNFTNTLPDIRNCLRQIKLMILLIR